MSLLDQNSFIEINLYYKHISDDDGKRLVVFSENRGKELLASPDESVSKSVEILKTKWSILTWKEQNEVMNLSSQVISPQTGEKLFNFVAYRDSIIKRCLKEWNIISDGNAVPVTSEAIDSLPSMVVTNLYQQFETIIDYTEKELGN